MTVIKFLNDKLGTYGTAYAYVDGVGGTPAVNEDAATAQTTPYATVAEAAVAIQTYNNTTFARNSASGGVIRLEVGTHVHSDYGNVITSATVPLLIESANVADKATTIYQDAGASVSKGTCNHLKIKSVVVQAAYNGIFLDNGAVLGGDEVLTLEDVTFDANGVGVSYYWIYRAGIFTMIDCDGDDVLQASTALTSQIKTIGCLGIGFVGAGVYNVVATKDLYTTFECGKQGYASTQDVIDSLCWFNHIGNGSTSNNCVSHTFNNTGLALVGNVFERYNNDAGPAVNVGTIPSNAMYNYIEVGNSCTGARTNQLYNDGSTVPAPKIGISSQSVHYTWNTKSDVFSADGANILNWSFVNRVGSSYRAIYWDAGVGTTQGEVGSWFGEVVAEGDVQGTEAVPMVFAWTDDQSYAALGVGDGDYRPIVGTTELPQIPAGKTAFPYDHMGQAVPIDGTAYVGALQAV